jgi:hypothetical protein
MDMIGILPAVHAVIQAELVLQAVHALLLFMVRQLTVQ